MDKYRINHSLRDEDADEAEAIKRVVRLQVKLNQARGFPVARFDRKLRIPYIEYPDGRREYAQGQ